MRLLILALFSPFLVLIATPALAASCGNDGRGFDAWRDAFIEQSSNYGLKQRVVKSSLQNVTYNKKVIRLDRNQKSFKLSFNQFYAKRVNNAMIRRGQKLGKTY
ncbi:MAG: lytic murein transglycosylase, partial [Roseibium sp.]